MNERVNTMSLPTENGAFALPQVELAQFVSDAQFQADQFFCSRLNVAALGAPPKEDCDNAQTHVFMLQTESRPIDFPSGEESDVTCGVFSNGEQNAEIQLDSSVVAIAAKAAGQENPAQFADDPVRVDGFTMAELERLAIRQTLQRCAGNRTKAAKMLGVSVRTLQRKLHAWNCKACETGRTG